MTYMEVLNLINAQYGGIKSIILWISEKLLDYGNDKISDQQWFEIWKKNKGQIIGGIAGEIAADHYPNNPQALKLIKEVIYDHIYIIEDNFKEAGVVEG